MCDKTLWSFYSPLSLHQRVSTNVLFVKYLGPSSFYLFKEFFSQKRPRKNYTRVWENDKRITQVHSSLLGRLEQYISSWKKSHNGQLTSKTPVLMVKARGKNPSKWKMKVLSGGSGLLQMIIRRIRPLANDQPENPASNKWSSGGTGHLQTIICHPCHPNHLSLDPDSILRTFLEQFVLV